MLSTTVTIAIALALLPLTSVTVKVTVFSPRFAQSNVFLSMLIEAISQLSVLPFSMSSAVIEISLPNSSNCNVYDATAIAVGATSSSIVTIEVPVETFPFTSVTVKVTVLSPTLLQSNVAISMVIVAIPLASNDPLSRSEAVIVKTEPNSSNCKVIFCVIIVGGVPSETIIVKLWLVLPPLLSLAFKTTIWVPTWFTASPVSNVPAVFNVSQAGNVVAVNVTASFSKSVVVIAYPYVSLSFITKTGVDVNQGAVFANEVKLQLVLSEIPS